MGKHRTEVVSAEKFDELIGRIGGVRQDAQGDDEKKYPARGFIPARIAKEWRNRSYTTVEVAGLKFGINTYSIENDIIALPDAVELVELTYLADAVELVEMTYLADVEMLDSPLDSRDRYCYYRWSGTAQELKDNAERANGNEIIFLGDERFEALEIGWDPTK